MAFKLVCLGYFYLCDVGIVFLGKDFGNVSCINVKFSVKILHYNKVRKMKSHKKGIV